MRCLRAGWAKFLVVPWRKSQHGSPSHINLHFHRSRLLKTLTSSKGQRWFFQHMQSGRSHHSSKTEGYRMNEKYTRPSSWAPLAKWTYHLGAWHDGMVSIRQEKSGALTSFAIWTLFSGHWPVIPLAMTTGYGYTYLAQLAPHDCHVLQQQCNGSVFFFLSNLRLDYILSYRT